MRQDSCADDDAPSDTVFSTGSFRAALRAAGAVCRAVDLVVQRRARHAMCLVRPPGHHAGVDGLSADGDAHKSCGFCVFNNVAQVPRPSRAPAPAPPALT